ncbi:MAG: heat-shock protein Hsp20 [Actinomycetia bacterium]|jgi:HSP20 family protein|nr:heat-shock protein Hsp20 [Actinomycetes bacterium]
MLMRFDPFRGLDRLAEELTGSAERTPRTFPMDAYRRGEDVVLLFDLPGVDPQSIDLTVDQHVLTVRAERRSEREDGAEVLAAERPQGSFVRRVFLGDALDMDRISAEYHNGVLQLTIPVSERAKPRKIEVAADGQQQAQPVGQQSQPVGAGT